jgi:hypothetical protein
MCMVQWDEELFALLARVMVGVVFVVPPPPCLLTFLTIMVPVTIRADRRSSAWRRAAV